MPFEQKVVINEKQVARFKRQSWKHWVFYSLPTFMQNLLRQLLNR